MNVDDEYRLLPIELLHEPRILLRPVDEKSIDFLERRDSIRRIGFLNAGLCRPSPKHEGMYEVIDGEWRRCAGIAAGVTHMPMTIRHGVSDYDALALQVAANAIRRETEPVEYCRQLRRIMDQDRTMSITKIAVMVGKSATWVKRQMHLLRLAKEIQIKVDRGEIPLASAYYLAKIPVRWREDWVEAAETLPTREFCAQAAGLIKQFQEHVAQGKLDEKCLRGFTPQPYMRGLKEVRSELANPTAGGLVMVKEGCVNLMDAWNACLKWLTHTDQGSIEQQQRDFQKRTFKSDQEGGQI